ncbi:thioredoxin domain-containing protein [Clostridium sp. CAG:433]|jgi:predicted bacteriocin transport accessory protein|nr:thioredoxin domain-containing protein [Clostridium sp. CAG:433]
MTKSVKILVIIIITVAIALTSFFVMKKAYDESQKELEEENRKAAESISNLTVIDVSKMKELFSSNDTKIIFVGSLTCPHCTAIKPVINSVVKDLNVTVYYLELSTMTDEENNEYYSINEFLKNNNSIPLVMAVKNNEVIDSFVGEKDSKDVEEFLKKNLNIE